MGTVLLTRNEAADFLRVKPHTLSVWAVNGNGPAPTKIGGRVVYRKDVLEDFVKQNTELRQEVTNE
jgi:predicted site-specific integrase-resolvase